MDQIVTMSSSDSEDVLELFSANEYRHQHPIFTYDMYRENEVTRRMAEVEEIDLGYLGYVKYMSGEKGRVAANVVYHGPDTNLQCECPMAKRGFCYHTLELMHRDRYKELLTNVDFDMCRAYLGLDIPDCVEQFIEQIEISRDTLSVPPYTRCSRCSLVQKALHMQHIPRHKCDKLKNVRYGLKSSFRYELPFRTPAGETIELDVNCSMINPSEFYLIIPEVSSIHYRLEGLGIDVTIMQVCYQDPLFYEIFGSLEAFPEVKKKLITYTMYLYLKYRLEPYLMTVNPDKLRVKLNPTPVIILPAGFEPDVINTLIGYDRESDFEAKIIQAPPYIRKIVRELKDKDDDYYLNCVTEGLVNVRTQEDYIEAYKILSRYRPTFRALRRYINYKVKVDPRDWPKFRKSPWHHIYSPDVNHLEYFIMTNIFDILPGESSMIWNRYVLRLGFFGRYRVNVPDYGSITTCSGESSRDDEEVEIEVHVEIEQEPNRLREPDGEVGVRN